MTGPSNPRVASQIRANIAFEKMIASVLIVAGLSGAGHALLGIGERLSAGVLSPAGVGSAAFNAISFVFLFFLAGFAASVAVGIPLFLLTERAKVRKTWPFVLAALFVSFVFALAVGLAPSVEAPGRSLYLVPGLAAAIIFGRKMQPFWLAADRADAAVAANVFRLN